MILEFMKINQYLRLMYFLVFLSCVIIDCVMFGPNLVPVRDSNDFSMSDRGRGDNGYSYLC